MKTAVRCPGAPRAVGSCWGHAGLRHASRSRRVQVHSSSQGPVLVDGLVVQPAYRSTPWDAEEKLGRTNKDKAQIMFVSESGICRAPLAAAVLRHMLDGSPLRDWVEVQERATRDYCIGQEPHPTAVAAAGALGTPMTTTHPSAAAQQPNPAAAAANGSTDAAAAANGTNGAAAVAAAAGRGGAVVFDPANDIVTADLVLVMDKYTAADVLREVSSYDLINPGGQYSARVRLLGSFHPLLSGRASQADGQDIDDPLYGNFGGQEEQVAVLMVAKLLHESCESLLQQLEGLAAAHGLLPAAAAAAAAPSSSSSNGSNSNDSNSNGSNSNSNASAGAAFRELLVRHVREEGVMNWLVPPMLQGSNTDLGGWV